jgi:leucyl/phenylalanyl-tRNA---protein transferase
VIPWLNDNDPFPPVHLASREYNGCWRRARICRCRVCWRPIGTASFPGSIRANRFCGGRPTRAWCCFRRNSSCRVRCANACSRCDYRVRVDTAFPGHAGLRRAARWRGGHLDQRGDDRGLWRIACGGPCAFDRNLDADAAMNWREGLYGVALGGCFSANRCSATNRCFQDRLAHLARWLVREDFGVIDCQMNTAHLASLGAREIPRRRFFRIAGSICRATGHCRIGRNWHEPRQRPADFSFAVLSDRDPIPAVICRSAARVRRWPRRAA